MIKIATIITCHNRKVKTLACLKSLCQSRDTYNQESENKIELFIYITDDGCTDGTADAIRNSFPSEHINILQGDGNLYWAGGMRFAWKDALKRHYEWDFYLLLNDDTNVLEGCFQELLKTHNYCLEIYQRSGLYSGITCSAKAPHRLTYGGDVWVNKFLGTMRRLDRSDKPQKCDLTNANILLVPSDVVDKIGIFYHKYIHDNADSDYSHYANTHGIPVLVTAEYCGKCDDDHPDREEQQRIVCSLSLKERKKYFNNPIHSSKDYLIYRSRVTPFRYPIVLLGRFLNLYFPKIYYKLEKGRW